jgi:NAD(P)H-flavin reductase
VANAPRKDGLMEFHVRTVGAGWVSGALVRKLRPGDMLRLAAPVGTMTVNRKSTRDIVCVAGGTGLAPVKAIVQELTRFNRTRWVHLFFGARTEDGLYDLPDLVRLAARYPWLSLVPACSHARWFTGERGNISTVLGRYGPWKGHDFFISGPPGMVRATLQKLTDSGVPAERIKFDPLPG